MRMLELQANVAHGTCCRLSIAKMTRAQTASLHQHTPGDGVLLPSLLSAPQRPLVVCLLTALVGPLGRVQCCHCR